MALRVMANPWRVGDSENEDEMNDRLDVCMSLPPRPPTSQYLSRRSAPKILDWNPVESDELTKGKFGRRRTAPSFEKAPSHHKPIFSGPPSLKSSSSSLSSSNSWFEQNIHEKTVVTNASESSTTNTSVSNSSFDPVALVHNDLNRFIHTYVPEDHSSFIRCCVRRDGVGIQKGLFPTFFLHMERPSDGKKLFVLAARKIAKVNRQSEYIITTSPETLTDKCGGDGYVGRLLENNIAGTAYTLYDNGVSPNKYKTKQSDDKSGLRRELAAVVYEMNILGLKGPRQISALIPELEHDIQPTKDENTILDQWRTRRFNYLLQLRNRSPEYIEDEKVHRLEFEGNRAVQPSIKNFQIIREIEDHEEEVVMQFGRVDKHLFVCDYRYPLSAIQAFGIALSSFDSRVTRE